MPFTYVPSKFNDSTPSSYYSSVPVGSRFIVRFLIHDTDPSRAKFLDEEIDWVLTQEDNVYAAACRCIDTLLAIPL